MFQSYYLPLLGFHSLLRWVVLAAALFALAVAASGWSGGKPSNRSLLRVALIFVAVIDLEFLLGLILYFAASPLTHQALQNMGAAMGVRKLRYFAVEHTLLMLLAVVFAHAGGALARKGKTVVAQYRAATVCFAISLLLMLGGIPWWRPFWRLGS